MFTKRDSPLVVADFTTNHMGNFNLLMAMVDAAYNCKVDVVKTQMKDVANFYAHEKLSRPFESPYGHTYYDYRKIFEFSQKEFSTISRICKKRRISFSIVPQDYASLVKLCSVSDLYADVKYWKIASSNARNHHLLHKFCEYLLPSDKHVVLSVAGSSLKEIESSLKILKGFDRIYLLHCVAEYPTPQDRLRLGNIHVLKNRFEDSKIKIGYSGHGVGMNDALAAYKMGASWIEKHFCMSRNSFVHHIECSLIPEEMGRLVDIIKKGLPVVADLTRDAYRSSFLMTDKERSFLENQVYGSDYLGDKI